MAAFDENSAITAFQDEYRRYRRSRAFDRVVLIVLALIKDDEDGYKWCILQRARYLRRGISHLVVPAIEKIDSKNLKEHVALLEEKVGMDGETELVGTYYRDHTCAHVVVYSGSLSWKEGTSGTAAKYTVHGDYEHLVNASHAFVEIAYSSSAYSVVRDLAKVLG